MPSAASGSTLAERAQHFLGLDLDAWLSSELESDGNPAPVTRTEQVAHAQRKHRQRTQSYIQALEEEVLRLRSVEVACKEEMAKLQEQLQSRHDAPKEQLEISAIQMPRNGGENGTPTLETIVVDWKEFCETAPEPPCCIVAAEETPPKVSWAADRGSNSQTEPQTAMWADAFADLSFLETSTGLATSKEVTEINEMPLSTQMGVMYILQLERPCMSHLKHAMESESMQEGYLETHYNWGTNHAYNLSTRLVNEHKLPSSPQVTRITSAELDRLLQASERLQLANELTPVQVWALICKLNAIYPINVEVITAMFEELSKHSYCNSFGTAISKNTIRAAFKHFLGWSYDLE